MEKRRGLYEVERAVRLNFVRQHNVKVILDLLYTRSYSCLELAELTHISTAAVNKILKQLSSLGIVEKEKENGDRKTVGGQHIRYIISSNNGVLVCVDFTHFKDTLVINDFNGEELFRKRYNFEYEDSLIFECDIQVVVDDIRDAMKQIKKDIYCISLCVPGQIDEENNAFIITGKFSNVKDDTLYRMFYKAFNCKVIIKNNVQMMAIGEYAYGNLKSKYNTSIYVYAGYGLASCSLYKGEIISGWRGYSGEIGGNRVNVITTLSMNCSIKRIIDRLKDHLETRDVEGLVKAFNENELVHQDIINVAKVLAADIVNMTNCIGADVVVINGESLLFGDEYVETIRSYLQKYCVTDIKLYTPMVNEAALKGGIELARKYSIENILDLKN